MANSIPDDAFDLLDAEVIRENDRSVLVKSVTLKENARGYRELWVWKDQIHDDSEVYRPGDRGTMLIKLGFAEREGLV